MGFPGSPAVKTHVATCRGTVPSFWSRENCGMAKKKKKIRDRDSVSMAGARDSNRVQ